MWFLIDEIFVFCIGLVVYNLGTALIIHKLM